MIIVVRHGATPSNVVGKERLRGWLPIGLDERGMREMLDVAARLKPYGKQIDSVHCGSHPRHVQSAQTIAQALGVLVHPVEALNDLNTGVFQGELVTDALINQIHTYYDEPDRRIPDGETVNTWMSRFLFRIRPLIEDPKKLYVVVTSGRSGNLILSFAATKGLAPDMSILKKRPLLDNGSIMVLDADWKRVFMSGEKPPAEAS